MRSEKLLPIITSIWLLVAMHSFFTWNNYSYLFHIIPPLLIIALSLQVINKNIHYINSNGILLSLLLLVSWIFLRHDVHINIKLLKLFDFIPLFFLLFLPKLYLYKTFDILRKIFIFYSIGCAIITVISFSGYLQYIPHYVLPAQETIHKELGLNYNVYGLFPILDNRDQFVRCCGMVQEPGHFSIYLGIVYMIDRLMRGKINYWLIPGAISAFSSTFFIIFFITEIMSLNHIATSQKKVRNLKYFFLFIVIVFFIYISLGETFKNAIEELFWGRQLGGLLTIVDQTNSLDSALDQRASEIGLEIYNKLDTFSILFGGTKLLDILSDYRGLIVTLGVVGILLSAICIITLSINSPLRMKLIISFVFLLVLIHRSWMIPSPVIYTLFFFAVTLSPNSIFTKEITPRFYRQLQNIIKSKRI